jgi:hypothetical protein
VVDIHLLELTGRAGQPDIIRHNLNDIVADSIPLPSEKSAIVAKRKKKMEKLLENRAENVEQWRTYSYIFWR